MYIGTVKTQITLIFTSPELLQCTLHKVTNDSIRKQYFFHGTQLVGHTSVCAQLLHILLLVLKGITGITTGEQEIRQRGET